MKRVLTFLSDFGSKSPYPAAMKAVAASIADARFIDITHEISPQNVLEGAFVLWSVAPDFPEGTVHCAVVDPGVGTERRGLILAAGDQYFVGPDNGLLVPAACTLGTPKAYEITYGKDVRRPISSTFHGRDVFAPVAAHLARGLPPQQLGRPISHLELVRPELDFQGGEFQEDRRRFQGQVVYIDRFGNAITNLRSQLILETLDFDEALTLIVKDHRQRVRLRRSYGYARSGELCLIPGSHGLLEISVCRGSAEQTLGLSVGEEVLLHLL